MTGAMYAAISGMKSHMSKLNVIGNNIANVNTYGYKASRATFRESIYSTMTGGSNGTATAGGINPSQVGYGCNVGTIDLDMSTKNYIPTGVNMDCMIDGDGFFMVGPKPATTGANGTGLVETDAKDLILTRVGTFEFDSQGYLTDGGGNVVYGYVTQSGIVAGTPGEQLDPDNPVTSTQLVPIRLPIGAPAPPAPPGANDPLEGAPLFPGVDPATGMNVYPAGKTIKPQDIKIDGSTGKITGVSEVGNKQYVIGYIGMANVSNPNGVTHLSGPYYRASEGSGDCNAASIGGAVTGNLNNQAAGAVGAKRLEGTGAAKLITGGLESSGTDLATEISEMITTQRGYQANTRIVTVTDSMLEELVNMKR